MNSRCPRLCWLVAIWTLWFSLSKPTESARGDIAGLQLSGIDSLGKVVFHEDYLPEEPTFFADGNLFEDVIVYDEEIATPGFLRDVRQQNGPNVQVNPVASAQERYPYVASLRAPFSKAHFCGGTLVAPRWILTNAHCLDFRRFRNAVPNPLVFMNGANINGPFREIHRVIRTFIHPKYRGAIRSPHNLALLKLDGGSNATPIRWPNSLPEHGASVTAVGWGRREPNGPFAKSLLEIRGLKVIDKRKCGPVHRLPSGLGCLKVNQNGVCAGIDGSPIIQSRNGVDTILGVALSSNECQGQSRPSPYVSVAEVRKWMQSVIFGQ